MKRNISIIVLLISICLNCYPQYNLCNNPLVFCSGTINSFPAPVNAGNAEIGPNYGCLTSQPNPIWYIIESAINGDFSLDIHSVPNMDIDFICWGPFTSHMEACTEISSCVGDQGSHYAQGPGGGYPSFKAVDCSGSSSYQEWCYIPNAQIGEYYILLITNFSNQNCDILINQLNYGQAGASMTTCWIAGCYVYDPILIFESCNIVANTFSLNGNISFQGIPSCGQCVLTDQPSGVSQTINLPYNFIPFSLNNIPLDGLEHTLTVFFPDVPGASFTKNYFAPNSCSPCSSNAGANITVCGLQTNLNAIELPNDSNTHWLSQNGICLSSNNDANSIAIADTFGIYNLVWQITDSSNFSCTDTVLLEFVDPALCTSVIENKVHNLITIFPNPSINGYFNINYFSKSFDNISIKIINTQGVEIFRKSISKKTESIEIQIDSSGLIDGYYIVEINDGQKIIRKPLVVQNIF